MRKCLFLSVSAIVALAFVACSGGGASASGLFKDVVSAAKNASSQMESLKKDAEKAAASQDLKAYANLAQKAKDAETKAKDDIAKATESLKGKDIPFEQSADTESFKVSSVQFVSADSAQIHLKAEVTFAADLAEYKSFPVSFVNAKGEEVYADKAFTDAGITLKSVKAGDSGSLFINVPADKLDGVEKIVIK
jgi:hypothetical protein